jgi:hypothetical protein
MTPEDLRAGMYWLTERLYRDDSVEIRRRAFFENMYRRSAAIKKSRSTDLVMA